MVTLFRRENRKKWFALALAVFAIASALIWFATRESEGDRVKKQLQNLCFETSKRTKLGDLVLAAKARTVQKAFAPKCEFAMDGRYTFEGTFENGAIASMYLNTIRQLERVEFAVSDFSEVEFPSGSEAFFTFTGHVVGRAGNDDGFDEVREFSCVMRKLDGEWRITSVKVRGILRR